MNVSDLEIAKYIFNPKRIRILKLIENQAKKEKEIATELNEKPSRLYYDVHKLPEISLLQVVDTKQVGHLTETYYKSITGMDSFDIDEAFAKVNTDFLANQLLSYVNIALAFIKNDLTQEKSVEEASSTASIINAKLSQLDWYKLNAEIHELICDRVNKTNDKEDNKRRITYIFMSYAEEPDNKNE